MRAKYRATSARPPLNNSTVPGSGTVRWEMPTVSLAVCWRMVWSAPMGSKLRGGLGMKSGTCRSSEDATDSYKGNQRIIRPLLE